MEDDGLGAITLGIFSIILQVVYTWCRDKSMERRRVGYQFICLPQVCIAPFGCSRYSSQSCHKAWAFHLETDQRVTVHTNKTCTLFTWLRTHKQSNNACDGDRVASMVYPHCSWQRTRPRIVHINFTKCIVPLVLPCI